MALIALVVWKVSQAIAGDPVEGSDGSDRAKYAVKGLLYSGAALASLSILIANWGGALPALFPAAVGAVRSRPREWSWGCPADSGSW